MTITGESQEMTMSSHIMIAHDHYTLDGLKELVDSYNNPELSAALECVIEENTIDIIIQFFLDNPEYYPVQSNN